MTLQTVHAVAIDGEGSTAVYVFPDEGQARDVYNFAANYNGWREASICRFQFLAPFEVTPEATQAHALSRYVRGLAHCIQQRRILRFTPRVSQADKDAAAQAMADFHLPNTH